VDRVTLVDKAIVVGPVDRVSLVGRVLGLDRLSLVGMDRVFLMGPVGMVDRVTLVGPA